MSPEPKTTRFLRLISFLSSGYPKTKEECIALLGIKDPAFIKYNGLFNTMKKRIIKSHSYEI